MALLQASRLIGQACVPVRLRGRPQEYGVTLPERPLTVQPEEFFRYAYRASAVNVSLSGSYQVPSVGTYRASGSFQAVRYGGEEGGNFDFYGTRPSQEAKPSKIVEIISLRTGVPRVSGEVPGTFTDTEGQVYPVTAGVSLVFSSVTSLQADCFVDSRSSFLFPGFQALVSGMDFNHVSGTFLGGSFAVNTAVSSAEPRRAASVQASISGGDLPLF